MLILFYVVFIGTALIYLFWDFLIPKGFHLFKKNDSDSEFNDHLILNYRHLLIDNFVLYKLLDNYSQKEFEKRVSRFIHMKEFRAGKGIEEITDEMRIMIAASAIQVTYGYPDVFFRHFDTILIFADDYFSTITRKYHEGEVNAAGAIVLSWKSFLSGFSNLADGKNLAIHEMAHALQLSNIVDNEEYDFIDSDIILNFNDMAAQEMQRIKNGDHSFFRSYCSANLEEFFSVAVECYFEQPEGFYQYNSELYSIMAKILKVDLLKFGPNK